MTILAVLLGLILLGALALCLCLSVLGKEKVVLKVAERTPLAVDEITDNSISFSTKFQAVNEGKQCATIMDAIFRSQLPYEQYDGLEIRGKIEREGEPREDDYFEAVLIQKKGDKEDNINLIVKVTLTARKGLSLKEALANMVDLPLEVIYLETGRTPCHYSKVRIVIPAEEIIKLAV